MATLPFRLAAKPLLALALLFSVVAAVGCRSELGGWSNHPQNNSIILLRNVDLDGLASKCGMKYGHGSLRILYEDGRELAMRSSGSDSWKSIVFRAGGTGRHYLYFTSAPGVPRNDSFQETRYFFDVKCPVAGCTITHEADRYLTMLMVHGWYKFPGAQWSPSGIDGSYIYKRTGEEVPLTRVSIIYGDWNMHRGYSDITIDDPTGYIFPEGYIKTLHSPMNAEIDRVAFTYFFIEHNATASLFYTQAADGVPPITSPPAVSQPATNQSATQPPMSPAQALKAQRKAAEAAIRLTLNATRALFSQGFAVRNATFRFSNNSLKVFIENYDSSAPFLNNSMPSTRLNKVKEFFGTTTDEAVYNLIKDTLATGSKSKGKLSSTYTKVFTAGKTLTVEVEEGTNIIKTIGWKTTVTKTTKKT